MPLFGSKFFGSKESKTKSKESDKVSSQNSSQFCKFCVLQ